MVVDQKFVVIATTGAETRVAACLQARCSPRHYDTRVRSDAARSCQERVSGADAQGDRSLPGGCRAGARMPNPVSRVGDVKGLIRQLVGHKAEPRCYRFGVSGPRVRSNGSQNPAFVARKTRFVPGANCLNSEVIIRSNGIRRQKAKTPEGCNLRGFSRRRISEQGEAIRGRWRILIARPESAPCTSTIAGVFAFCGLDPLPGTGSRLGRT